jgi:hypothetical protein
MEYLLSLGGRVSFLRPDILLVDWVFCGTGTPTQPSPIDGGRLRSQRAPIPLTADAKVVPAMRQGH